MDNKAKFFIVLPLACIILLVYSAYYVPFETRISGTEQAMLEFIHADLNIQEKKEKYVSGAFTDPFDFRVVELSGSTADVSDSSTETDLNDNEVSLIVMSGNSKMAIIQGELLKEGDTVADKKVIKIEPNRVLLKNKTAQWVYLGTVQ